VAEQRPRTTVGGGRRDCLNIKLILEDIRRTAEHATDIAEAAMNETVGDVIEKPSTVERKPRS